MRIGAHKCCLGAVGLDRFGGGVFHRNGQSHTKCVQHLEDGAECRSAFGGKGCAKSVAANAGCFGDLAYSVHHGHPPQRFQKHTLILLFQGGNQVFQGVEAADLHFLLRSNLAFHCHDDIELTGVLFFVRIHDLNRVAKQQIALGWCHIAQLFDAGACRGLGGENIIHMPADLVCHSLGSHYVVSAENCYAVLNDLFFFFRGQPTIGIGHGSQHLQPRHIQGFAAHFARLDQDQPKEIICGVQHPISVNDNTNPVQPELSQGFAFVAAGHEVITLKTKGGYTPARCVAFAAFVVDDESGPQYAFAIGVQAVHLWQVSVVGGIQPGWGEVGKVGAVDFGSTGMGRCHVGQTIKCVMHGWRTPQWYILSNHTYANKFAPSDRRGGVWLRALTNRATGHTFALGARTAVESGEERSFRQSGWSPRKHAAIFMPGICLAHDAPMAGRPRIQNPQGEEGGPVFVQVSNAPAARVAVESCPDGVVQRQTKGTAMATNAKSLHAISVADLNPSITNEPRILDLTVAQRLGFVSPPMIRKLIERNADELATYGVLSTVEKTSGAKGGRPGREYWLNEGQALLVCALSRTPQAAAVRKSLIDVFMAWRTGHLKPANPDTTQQQRADTRAINKLAHDWSQRDFRRYQAWLGDHLQKLRDAGWQESAEAALAQLSVDPTLIGTPASQCPLIGDERIGVGTIRLTTGWLVFDSRFEANSLRANEQVLAISADGALGTVTLADCWAGPDRYAQVPHYGPRTGWAAVPSTIGPNVRAARAVMVLGRILSGRKVIAKAGSKA